MGTFGSRFLFRAHQQIALVYKYYANVCSVPSEDIEIFCHTIFFHHGFLHVVSIVILQLTRYSRRTSFSALRGMTPRPYDLRRASDATCHHGNATSSDWRVVA